MAILLSTFFVVVLSQFSNIADITFIYFSRNLSRNICLLFGEFLNLTAMICSTSVVLIHDAIKSFHSGNEHKHNFQTCFIISDEKKVTKAKASVQPDLCGPQRALHPTQLYLSFSQRQVSLFHVWIVPLGPYFSSRFLMKGCYCSIIF